MIKVFNLSDQLGRAVSQEGVLHCFRCWLGVVAARLRNMLYISLSWKKQGSEYVSLHVVSIIAVWLFLSFMHPFRHDFHK